MSIPATFLRPVEFRSVSATPLGVLNWLELRQALGAARRAANLTEAQLAFDIGKPKSTIYRIENTDELPKHKPDLETIDRWLSASGVRLSDFFRRIEAPETATSDPVAVAIPDTKINSNNGINENRQVGHTVPSTTVAHLDEDRHADISATLSSDYEQRLREAWLEGLTKEFAARLAGRFVEALSAERDQGPPDGQGGSRRRRKVSGRTAKQRQLKLKKGAA